MRWPFCLIRHQYKTARSVTANFEFYFRDAVCLTLARSAPQTENIARFAVKRRVDVNQTVRVHHVLRIFIFRNRTVPGNLGFLSFSELYKVVRTLHHVSILSNSGWGGGEWNGPLDYNRIFFPPDFYSPRDNFPDICGGLVLLDGWIWARGVFSPARRLYPPVRGGDIDENRKVSVPKKRR